MEISFYSKSPDYAWLSNFDRRGSSGPMRQTRPPARPLPRPSLPNEPIFPLGAIRRDGSVADRP